MKTSSKYLFIFPISAILFFLLSCATGYNKYANQYYQEGLAFMKKLSMIDRLIVSKRFWNWHHTEKIMI